MKQSLAFSLSLPPLLLWVCVFMCVWGGGVHLILFEKNAGFGMQTDLTFISAPQLCDPEYVTFLRMLTLVCNSRRIISKDFKNISEDLLRIEITYFNPLTQYPKHIFKIKLTKLPKLRLSRSCSWHSSSCLATILTALAKHCPLLPGRYRFGQFITLRTPTAGKTNFNL